MFMSVCFVLCCAVEFCVVCKGLCWVLVLFSISLVIVHDLFLFLLHFHLLSSFFCRIVAYCLYCLCGFVYSFFLYLCTAFKLLLFLVVLKVRNCFFFYMFTFVTSLHGFQKVCLSSLKKGLLRIYNVFVSEFVKVYCCVYCFVSDVFFRLLNAVQAFVCFLCLLFSVCFSLLFGLHVFFLKLFWFLCVSICSDLFGLFKAFQIGFY